MDSEFVSQLMSKLWTKKTVGNSGRDKINNTSDPVQDKNGTTLSPTEVDKVTQTLEWIRPALEFIHHPEKQNVIGFLPYIIAVITVLGLSGLVFNARWKKGSLNQFVDTQHKALVKWSRKKYLVLAQKESQRELTRQLSKQERRRKERLDAEEYQRRQSSQSWAGFFKDKLTGMAPHNMVKTLLDPTSPYSWGLLGGMWVQYMTGTHLPYIGSQLPFGAVATASAAKVMIYVGHLIRTLIRKEIYGDDYDPLFIRLPNALMVSFLELLHYRLTKLQLGGETPVDDVELEEIRKEISELKNAQQAMAENVKEITSGDIAKPIGTLVTEVRDIQEMSRILSGERTAQMSELDTLVKLSLIQLKPLVETDFCGSVKRSGSFSMWVEYTDPVYLKIWILLAEYILQFVDMQDKSTYSLEVLGNRVDETNTKNVRKWTGTNDWYKFKDERTSIDRVWETQRQSMTDLRKYITVYVLNPTQSILSVVDSLKDHKSNRHMTLDVLTAILNLVKKGIPSDVSDSDIPWNLFLTSSQQKQLEGARDQLQHIGEDETLPLAERNYKLQQQLKHGRGVLDLVIEQSKAARNTYIIQVYWMLQRHKATIPACKSACQLLKYYVACKDAFDISMMLYDKNWKLKFSPNFWEDSKQFLNMSDLYNILVDKGDPSSLGVTLTHVQTLPYSEALGNVYVPLARTKQSYMTERIRIIMGQICSIYHLEMKLDPLDDGSVRDVPGQPEITLHASNVISVRSDLKRIHTLYNVSTQCSETPACQDCDCTEVNNNINSLSLPSEVFTHKTLESIK